MAMTNRDNSKFDSFIIYTLDELVPQDHLVRKLENALDFRFKGLFFIYWRPCFERKFIIIATLYWRKIGYTKYLIPHGGKHVYFKSKNKCF